MSKIRTKEAARAWRAAQQGVLARLIEAAQMTHWLELAAGTQIDEGTRVRYFARVYECTRAHTKTVLKTPLADEYWKEVTI